MCENGHFPHPQQNAIFNHCVIPIMMTLYGPLIHLWEGSIYGESYLRHAKPKITNILVKIGI